MAQFPHEFDKLLEDGVKKGLGKDHSDVLTNALKLGAKLIGCKPSEKK